MRFLLLALLLLLPLPAFASDGAAVFKANCVTCHGEAMDGNGPAGQYMNPKPRNLKKDKLKAGDDKDTMFNTVTNGLTGTAMAGFGTSLSDEDRHAVIDFVCSQRDNHCPAAKAKKKKKSM